MTYCVIDLETLGSTTYKRFCNPLDPRHKVILNARKQYNEDATVICNPAYYKEGLPRHSILEGLDLNKIDFMVGQNFKFDLLWFWDDPTLQEWIKKGGKVWDTQTIEYLLTGQAGAPRNLDALTKKYGGTVFKDPEIMVMMKEGIPITDIDPNKLMMYAKYDVLNTELVMQQQYQQLQKHNMLPLALTYMDHYLAVCEMEYNGMYVDKEMMTERQLECEKEIIDLEVQIKKYVGDENFNGMSNQQVSRYLFGEVRSVGVGVLEAMEDSKHADFISMILHLRKLNKLLKTYLYKEELYKRDNKKRGIKAGDVRKTSGLKSCIMPDGCVHSEFKTDFTATGRLSSRNPNLQNVDPRVLDMFTSRWKDDGVILEVDYSQLEVVIQAYITQSANMIQDIKDDVDFHCLRLSYAENKPYDEVVRLCSEDPEWKAKRKKAKIVSFQRAYGAHEKKISASTGLSVDVIKTIFEKEEERYPEIKKFYENMVAKVNATRKPKHDLMYLKDQKTGATKQLEGVHDAYGYYQSLTGKLYTFQERGVITKNNKIFTYWNMPNIQNYPIQGTAADLVALQVGLLFKELIHNRDKCLLINEVHDAVLLDVKKEHLDWTIQTVCSILEDVSTLWEKRFKVKFNAPISVDASYGASWGECK